PYAVDRDLPSFPTTTLFRSPRVIEIQHRRHRVHAKAVGVILLQPEQRAAQQKRAYFVAAVVEHQGPPLTMLALARIGVLNYGRQDRKSTRLNSSHVASSYAV